MFRSASLFLLTSALTVLSVAACTSGEVAVGSSEQNLQTRKNGQPTGDGQTCSWDDTVAYDVASGQQTTTPAPNGPYQVGETFKSLDGCNDCTCTKSGIMCTERACSSDPNPGGNACTDDAKQCPDGSYVGRTGPRCEFAPCPGEGAVCTADVKKCPDGSYVGRTGPSCEFAPCPGDGTVCDADAKQCPDGTWVGRTPPSCDFVCP